MGKLHRERSLPDKREAPDKEAQAIARNLRISPQKLNLIAMMIRGKRVDQALNDLEFSRKRIAIDVRKCVMSAIANAENNHNLDVNQLVVQEAWVGKNIVMKRFAARGRGRGSAIFKPFSEITVVVRETEPVVKEPKTKAGAKSAPKAKPAKAASAKKEAV